MEWCERDLNSCLWTGIDSLNEVSWKLNKGYIVTIERYIIIWVWLSTEDSMMVCWSWKEDMEHNHVQSTDYVQPFTTFWLETDTLSTEDSTQEWGMSLFLCIACIDIYFLFICWRYLSKQFIEIWINVMTFVYLYVWWKCRIRQLFCLISSSNTSFSLALRIVTSDMKKPVERV